MDLEAIRNLAVQDGYESAHGQRVTFNRNLIESSFITILLYFKNECDVCKHTSHALVVIHAFIAVELCKRST